MDNFNENNGNPLENTTIKVADKPHISIKNKEKCINNCKNKPCTYYCPSFVYSWSEKKQKIIVSYEKCIECGACPWGCPYNNIIWEFPPGGYGIIYNI